MQEKTSILLVDDNLSLCKATSFILERKGYYVAIAEDGHEAIKKVENVPFDLIFMDIKMPLMDGVEAFRRIKEIKPESTVVMMTAYSVDAMVKEALQEGAYGVIYKPLDMDEIIALIKKVRKKS